MAKYYEQHIPPRLAKTYDYTSVNLADDGYLEITLDGGFRYIMITVNGGVSGASFEVYNNVYDDSNIAYESQIGAKDLLTNQEVLTLDAGTGLNKTYILLMPNINFLSLKNVVGAAFDGLVFLEAIMES